MRRVVMVACAALLLLSVNMKSRTSQDLPARTAFCTLSISRISVKVSGAVLHPGVYEVPANMLADNVIKMAEPLRQLKQYKTVTTVYNQLHNGSAITLMTEPDGSQLVTLDEMTVPERLILKIPLEITAMSEVDFDRLPGIGPALARRIVVCRQNNGGLLRVEDLMLVDGIGEKKYATIRSYFQHAVK